MKRSFRSVLVLAVAGLLGAVLAMGSLAGDAAAKGKGKKAVPAASSDAPKNDVNACGCYRNAQGACFCAKKGKCGCQGECEPKGCEEKRDKEIEKEIAAETRRAADSEKKQQHKGGDEQADEDKPAPKPRPKKR